MAFMWSFGCGIDEVVFFKGLVTAIWEAEKFPSGGLFFPIDIILEQW